MSNQSDPARQAQHAHKAMQQALEAYNRAEQNAVICFAEIRRQHFYRALGFGSIHQYAEEALGFSRSKTFHFLRLIDALETLPALRAAVTEGEIGWTKAREIIKAATPGTDEGWVIEAKKSSRRELERKVARVRARAAARRAPAQPELIADTAQAAPAAKVEVPVSLTIRMTSLQRARFETLMEKVRKQGISEDRAEVLLAALENLAGGGGKSPRGDSASHYQIVVSKCESCGGADVLVGGKPRRLSAAQAAAIECDAKVLKPGGRNKATIRPSVRREVLARDGHRCRAPGCTHTRFLEVHHVVPRAAGGTNRPENLITLCGSCHRVIHESGNRDTIGGGSLLTKRP